MAEKTDKTGTAFGKPPETDKVTNEKAKQAVEGGSRAEGKGDAQHVETAVTDLDNGLSVRK
jgi:hypothetical protein